MPGYSVISFRLFKVLIQGLAENEVHDPVFPIQYGGTRIVGLNRKKFGRARESSFPEFRLLLERFILSFIAAAQLTLLVCDIESSFCESTRIICVQPLPQPDSMRMFANLPSVTELKATMPRSVARVRWPRPCEYRGACRCDLAGIDDSECHHDWISLDKPGLAVPRLLVNAKSGSRFGIHVALSVFSLWQWRIYLDLFNFAVRPEFPSGLIDVRCRRARRR